jgi:hypothetical protein
MANTALEEMIGPDVIRSVLTISDSNLPDSVIENYGLEDEIGAFLDKVIPDWFDIETGRPLRLLRIFIKYKAAAIIAATAPIFVLKKETDGNNEGQRSDRDGFLWVADRMAAKANEALTELMDELEIERPGGIFDLVGKVEPLRDVILTPRDL